MTQMFMYYLCIYLSANISLKDSQDRQLGFGYTLLSPFHSVAHSFVGENIEEGSFRSHHCYNLGSCEGAFTVIFAMILVRGVKDGT